MGCIIKSSDHIIQEDVLKVKSIQNHTLISSHSNMDCAVVILHIQGGVNYPIGKCMDS